MLHWGTELKDRVVLNVNEGRGSHWPGLQMSWREARLKGARESGGWKRLDRAPLEIGRASCRERV